MRWRRDEYYPGLQPDEKVGAQGAPFMLVEDIDLKSITIKRIAADGLWEHTFVPTSQARSNKPDTWEPEQTYYTWKSALQAAHLEDFSAINAIARFDKERQTTKISYTKDGSSLLVPYEENRAGVILRPNRNELQVVLGALTLGRHREFKPVETASVRVSWPGMRRIQCLH